MYTEYVFENKRYEVASREIKATLFGIITTEEEKIAKLREKAFVDATDPRQAAELQNLYVQQDACLREILSISDQLTKSLQRVDTCSRKLKQIEDKNIAQIIATIHDANEAQQMMAMQPPQPQVIEVTEPEMVAQTQTYEAPVMVGEPVMVADEGDAYAAGQVSSAADVAMAPEPVDEPVMESEAPVVHEVMEVPEDVAASIEEKKAQIVHEVMDVPEETTATTGAPQEDVKEDVIHEVMDIPEEEAVATTGAPQEEQKEDIIHEVMDIPEEEEKKTEEVVADASAGPLITPTTDAPQEIAIAPSSDPVAEPVEEAAPVITATTDAPQEVQSSGPLIPVEDNSTVVADAATESSGPLIPPAEDTDTASNTTQVITISSDGPLEATSGGPLIPTGDSTEVTGGAPEMAIPEIVPDAEVKSDDQLIPIDEAPTTAAGDTLVFKKRTADPPKVIMISGKQAANLKKSLPTQEALLSAKGFFKGDAPAEGNLEQQLINNGLLEPDTAAKQAQIEQMMAQANELYAAGKVEEAQTMYNQISELNKELQGESEGIAK